MSVAATPSPTCEVTWIENGVIVTDGLPAVVVGYFHPRGIPNLVPMTSMCSEHYNLLNARELAKGFWTFNKVAAVTGFQIKNPNIQAPPKLDLESKSPSWLLRSLTTVEKLFHQVVAKALAARRAAGQLEG